MDRREALTLLTSLPAVTRISRATVSPSTVIVIECPGAVSSETAERIMKSARQVWPDNQCVVLSDGMTVKVLDQLQPGRK